MILFKMANDEFLFNSVSINEKKKLMNESSIQDQVMAMIKTTIITHTTTTPDTISMLFDVLVVFLFFFFFCFTTIFKLLP